MPAWALPLDGNPATLCPACYVHTVKVLAPPLVCPTPRPMRACDISCARALDSGAAAGLRTTVTVTRPTTVTQATETATVPGANPACPTTATVSVTVLPLPSSSFGANSPAASGDAGSQCPDHRVLPCACVTPVTVVVTPTVAVTETVYQTAAPLTCTTLTSSKAIAAVTPSVTRRNDKGDQTTPTPAALYGNTGLRNTRKHSHDKEKSKPFHIDERAPRPPGEIPPKRDHLGLYGGVNTGRRTV
ncbi:hypothetical protein SPI_07963 [Niveomyces insectorum RCEF 264]|uniref:Uncharacterized protein n=1 Tax=Niveomyces insectorum RCEF 264 TaxID=1081102 RepID=A0A167P6U8_9HYPO|nr:hypothetical protein SPI_07963 [Niveomyces insectorum RCEF 264]